MRRGKDGKGRKLARREKGEEGSVVKAPCVCVRNRTYEVESKSDDADDVNCDDMATMSHSKTSKTNKGGRG